MKAIATPIKEQQDPAFVSETQQELGIVVMKL